MPSPRSTAGVRPPLTGVRTTGCGLLLGGTIVAVARAGPQRGLGAGPADLPWVVDGYPRALAGLLRTAAAVG